MDAVEALAAKYAEAWPAWGHRKIAALMRADSYQVSTSTVQRALRRRGLLLPVGYRADRKFWAVLRRRVFLDPPTQRNRVWQMDFSEFETAGGGIWRICAVIDYATKYCLAARLTPTSRAADALACLHAAVAEAQRLLDLDDLRVDRGVMDILGPDDVIIGQAPAPIAVVTDNGSAFKAATFAAAFTGEDPRHQHSGHRYDHPCGALMKVVVAEDSVLFREGLVRLLTDLEHEVLAAVGDAPALLAAVSETRPQLAIVDVRMPPDHESDGSRAARTIRESDPQIGILLLSQHIELRHCIELIGTPGFGYLLKDRVKRFLDSSTPQPEAFGPVLQRDHTPSRTRGAQLSPDDYSSAFTRRRQAVGYGWS